MDTYFLEKKVHFESVTNSQWLESKAEENLSDLYTIILREKNYGKVNYVLISNW